jgi:peptidoglycan/xylan/chitin deacetylase (PgdA/CDA1 family)
VKEALARLLCALGIGALFRWRNRRRLLVLMYHGVVEGPLRTPCWTQVPVDAFRRQMAWVARRYRVLPLVEALDALRAGTLPRRTCALTFDDGLRNVATVAGPVLAEHGFHATVFLSTGVVGTNDLLWMDRLHAAVDQSRASALDASVLGLGVLPLRSPAERAAASTACGRILKTIPRAEKDRRLGELVAALGEPGDPGAFRALTWEEVDAMRRGGLFDFAPHTVRHEILSRCEDEVVRSEVGESTREVTRRTGSAPRVFAYPNGAPADFDARARDEVSRHGMAWALSTIEGLAGADEDPLAVRRIGVGDDLSLPRLSLLASGALSALRGRRAGY